MYINIIYPDNVKNVNCRSSRNKTNTTLICTAKDFDNLPNEDFITLQYVSSSFN